MKWLRHPVFVAAVGLVLAAIAVVAALGPSHVPPDADLRNGRVFIQDNLWSTDDAQYAVWVAPDGTAYAGRRSRGGDWTRVDLRSIAGNPFDIPTANDNHNVYAVAVDSLGYVHIVGNMHSDPLRYVRSSRPGDLGSLEPGVIAGPAASVTYPRFVALPDKTLLFLRREGSAGDGAILLDVLPAGEEAWEHVGAVLDGRATGEGVYVEPAVDPRDGTVHLFFEWRGGLEAASTNDLGYARSRDGGRSWETSTGEPLEVPITHERAETIVDTPPQGSGLGHADLTVDADGDPHGLVTFHLPDGGTRLEHTWHDGAQWQRDKIDAPALDGRPAIVGMPDGGVWLFAASGTTVVAFEVSSEGLGDEQRLFRVPFGWEVSYDMQALIQRCRVEVLVPRAAEPAVVVADLPPAADGRASAACGTAAG